MTTETTTQTLSPEDIKALSTADTVVFRHRAGVTTLEPRLDAHAEQRIYTAAEQRLFPQAEDNDRRRVITVAGSVTGYDEDTSRVRFESGSGYSMCHGARYSPLWSTVAGLLRPRDEVHLSFTGDTYSNGYSKDAGLHVDEMRLTIHRGRNTRLTFLLDVSVCADNSARMVKP